MNSKICNTCKQPFPVDQRLERFIHTCARCALSPAVPADGSAMPLPIWRRCVSLCHPDRHPVGSAAHAQAEHVSAWLMANKPDGESHD